MRLLLPVSLLAVTVAAETWKDVIETTYGKCGGKCMITQFEKQDCGDVASSSSTSCYCGKYVDITTISGESMEYPNCLKACDLVATDFDFAEWANNINDLCDRNWGGTDQTSPETATTGSSSDTGATPTGSGTAPTSTGGGSDDSGGSEDSEESATPSGSPSATPPPEDAASTLSSSKAALLVGALAFLGFALRG